MIDLRPRLRVELKTGFVLDLRYTLAAVYRLQSALGRGLKADSSGCVSMAELRALIWAMHSGSESAELIGSQLGIGDIGKVIEGVSMIVRSSTINRRAAAAAAESDEPMLVDWLDLWAIAKIDMRLTDSEFWGLTPAMFDALLNRLKRKYGVEEEKSKEQQVESVLRKVEAINAAMGGRDLRGVSNGS